MVAPVKTTLDRHPRYARPMVERFASGEVVPLLTRRRRIA
jgi:hypothetical protein